jgi:hypothetical protein
VSGPDGSAAATPAEVGPFVPVSGCQPQPACNSRAARRVVKVTRTVVRPGRKKGGTTVVFRLSRPAVLDITVTRVYPTCKRIGTFTVRGQAGTNRVRFRGRLRGRALPPGSYRLVVRARGATNDVAAIPIVIAGGPMSAKELKKARRASVCREPIADLPPDGVVYAASMGGDRDGSAAGAVLSKIKRSLHAPFKVAARTAKEAARGFGKRVDEAADDPVGRAVLTLVGMIALASSILGALVLTRILRTEGFTVRRA